MPRIGVAIKKSGKPQRSNVKLTQSIAGALINHLLEGNTIYKHRGNERIKLEIVNAGGEREFILLPTNTVRNWCARGNVVPETGKTLKDILDQAREEYRVRKIQEMDKMRLEIIDKKFNRVISMRTKEPVIGMFGPIVDRETKKPLMRENAHLLKIQMDNVQYLAERLDSGRYGKVEKTENKHLVFSLSDLRKAKEDIEQNETVS